MKVENLPCPLLRGQPLKYAVAVGTGVKLSAWNSAKEGRKP